MSEFKHTTGAWEVLEASWDEDGNVRYSLAGIKQASVADARLIAAAPELLEALEAITDLYDTDEGCRSLPEYNAARAAIAKATGGTNDH